LPTQSTIFDLLMGDPPSSASGKTSPESSTPPTTRSDASWERWLDVVPPSFRHEDSGGSARVWLMDPNDESYFAPSMPSISEYPNADDVCLSSLTDVLWDGPVPKRYYLSAKACRGILRRARARGRELPRLLRLALEHVAQTTTRHKPVTSSQKESLQQKLDL